MSKGIVLSVNTKFPRREVPKCTYFFCRECSDLGVGGWVSTNPNIVLICKSVQIIGRSLRRDAVNCK